MNNKWIEKNIPIKNLILWDENARFPEKYFQKPEGELIQYFFAKQGKRDFKIMELAESIVKDFDLPQLEKIIVYNTEDKNIVLEGNRRLTVYKVLNNPSLAPNESIKKKFIELKEKIDIDDNFELACVVTENEVEGFRYIERKHLNNNNEVSWGEQERTNHNKRRGNATKKEEFKIAIAKIVKELNVPEELKEQILGPGYVTNFWRILDGSPAWKQFGFDLDEFGNLTIKDKDFKEKLKVIIVNVLQKQDFSGNKIDSRTLNKNKEKEVYLKSIAKDDFMKAESEIEKKTIKNLFDEQSVNIANISAKARINPKSTRRNYIIPKTCRLYITENKKINNIYRELREDLPLDRTVNAAGVLFRVFLETSLDFYIQKKSVSIQKDTKLAGKITKVSDDMESRKLATKGQLTNIRKVATNNPSILSIDNFHDYVHCLKVLPTPDDLILKWDNLEEFFTILWNSLKPKKQK